MLFLLWLIDMYHFTIGLFIAIILSAVVSVVNAAETRPYMYRVQQTAQLQQLLNRGSVPVTYETVATTSTGQQVTRYTTRATAVNTARLGSIARSAVGGPAVLAATAAFLAYDYFYNEDTEQWEVSASSPPDDIGSGTTCRFNTAVVGPDNLTASECIDWIKNYSPSNPPSVWGTFNYASQTATQRSWCLNIGSVSGCNTQARWTVVFPAGSPVSHDWEPSYNTLPAPASDLQLGDAVKNAPPQAIADILNDPISTGTWPDRWPEMVPTTEEIEDQLGHDIEGAPAPVNPDQTITDGSTARPSADASAGSEASELPAFCDWVPDWLCDVMDLPEHPEVPFAEIAEPDGFDSGIGSGQCPADIIVSTQFGSVPISWEYPCELATTFRPVVLFFAWIAALYIVVRVK